MRLNKELLQIFQYVTLNLMKMYDTITPPVSVYPNHLHFCIMRPLNGKFQVRLAENDKLSAQRGLTLMLNKRKMAVKPRTASQSLVS